MTISNGATPAALNAPRVSVGLPVFNGEAFLREAIGSILRQDFTDFELIVSDNASTDRTARICEEYAAADGRIRYHRHETNIGAAPNHNWVFEQARGTYFKWAAHDDECRPELLRRCVEILDERPHVVLAYPQADLIDRSGQVTERYSASIACDDRRPHVRLGRLLETIGLGTPMYGVIRSRTLRMTRLHGSFIDADLILLGELAMLGEVYQVPLPLLRKRLHPGRSQEANRTRAELLAWFDPHNRNARSVLPAGYRMSLEYLRAVWSLPLRVSDKVACSAVIPLKRHRGVRLKRRIRTLLGVADRRVPSAFPHR